MKIQLLLEDMEVELGQNISIPLNKTFENLSNPTDIITEYSKSINIPLTSRNNEILSNSYRLDRTIIANDSGVNLGIYLDPTKKIPMKLLYNSQVVLEGYAKFASANNSTKNGCYTLNLFGTLGEIFQKLKSVVVSESQLTDEQKAEPDGGAKYVLRDRSAQGEKLNADYVHRSFEHNLNNIYGTYDGTGGFITSYDVIGFAPSYRGYYNEFDSKKIQMGNDLIDPESNFYDIDKVLENEWKATYKKNNPSVTDADAQSYAESLGAGNIVGDGFKDYQMREYRCYMMKPYIYFNQLMQMYQDQIKLISDYELELDTNWFNVNNPYWTRMCYMLDFLDSKDGNEDISVQLTDTEKLQDWGHLEASTSGFYEFGKDISIINDYVSSSKMLYTNPFNIRMHVNGIGPNSVFMGGDIDLAFPYSTYFKVTVSVYDGSTTQNRYFFVSFYDYKDVKSYINDAEFSENNFIKIAKPATKWQFFEYDKYLETGDFHDLKTDYYIDFDIPIDKLVFTFDRTIDNFDFSTSVKIVNQRQSTLYTAKLKISSSNIPSIATKPSTLVRSTATMTPIYMNQSWRDNIDISLSNIFFKEDTNLFDIILQYTKMFGLIWDIDYNTKKVKVLHKSTYFKDITIEDWTDKLDRSKDFIIEPITFNTRNVKFNYEDVDGYRYSGYRDKYGVNIGEKNIVTGYDFGNETKDLFKNITPSSASSKPFVSFYDWAGWDLSSTIPQTAPQNAFIDAEDEEQSSAISIYNWYLRGENKSIENSLIDKHYVTNDSPQMKQTDTYCWMDSEIARSNGIQIYSLPSFNIAIDEPGLFPQLQGRVLSCVFNTPNEDFTTGKLISKSNGNAIYDLFWKKFINERYNIQNKKVTAYINMQPIDFINFKFNKFITLNNQLFTVNKIFDYDINATNKLTKVELIQVTDMDVYKNGSESFPPVVISPNEINVVSDGSDYTNGNVVITAHITLFDENGELTRGYWGSLTGTFTYADGSTTSNSEDIWDYITLESIGGWEENIGKDDIDLYWYNMANKSFEGKLDYELPNGEVITIPISINYR